MATVKFDIDKRYNKKNKTYPIRLQVSLFAKRFYFPTGLSVSPENFSPTGGDNGVSWVSGNGKMLLNSTLRDIIAKATNAQIVLMADRRNKNISLERLKKRFSDIMDFGNVREPQLLETMKELAETKIARTRELYLLTVRKLSHYCPDDISMSEINKAWLDSFSSKELKYTSINSVAIHLRNIRAAFNYAIDNDLITYYPFRKFKIKKEITPKRSLTIEQLTELRTCQVEKYQSDYRDFFMLSFFLIGINPIDLMNLKEENFRNGKTRLVYNRRKTKRLYNIKVEPEALALIERLRGENWLIRPLDNWRAENFRHSCNLALGKIGKLTRKGRGGKKFIEPIEPDLTLYWARHTWATIAAYLDIPDATISAALGHNHLNPITAIYVDFDQRKIDIANRKVIDYVMSFPKEESPDITPGLQES